MCGYRVVKKMFDDRAYV